MRYLASACRVLFVCMLIPNLTLSAQNAPANTNFQIVEKGVGFQVPAAWSVEQHANMTRLLRTPQGSSKSLTARDRSALPQITTDTLSQKTHADALQRLRQIAAESATPSTYMTIAGWPALQRTELMAKPEMGREDKPFEKPGTLVHVTTAVAAGNSVFRMDGFVDQEVDRGVSKEMETIGHSLTFKAAGDARQADSEVHRLQLSAPLRPVAPATKPNSQAKSQFAPATATDTTGLSFNLSIGTEPEVAVSTDGKNVVVAQQCSFKSSNDGGRTFPNGGGLPHCGGGDSSLGFGKSGNFYEATIGGDPNCSANKGICATAINRSTDGGKTFSFLSNSVTCATSSCGFGGIPDQEHMAADRFNQTANGDQVYVAFRLGTGFDLSCSTDSGATFGHETQVNHGSSDFPRIAVGQDGSVYVVTTNGGNIEIDKYNSCASGLVSQFNQVVASSVTSVTCPVAGLDRCNNGNDLRSPTVAVDDTDANHVYVSYAINTSSGTNENIIVQDSQDGGNTWPGGRTAQVNNSIPARRFMPWVCSVGGAAYVSWYDRRNANPGANDLTDYFGNSVSLDALGNLNPGTDAQLNAPNTSDPECSGGQTSGSAQSWPCGDRSPADSGSCSAQPQLAGRCWSSGSTCGNPGGVGSGQACDQNGANTCPSGESCVGGSGNPKYGDYNGNACAAGRFYTVYGSGTSQPNTTPAAGINLFFTNSLVCCEPQIQVPGPVSINTCQGSTANSTVNVCNTGKTDLTINAISSSDTQISVSVPTSGYPVTISPDACFPFQASYSPSGTGPTTATLTISSNDTVTPSAKVTINGTSPAPSINATIAKNGNFGNVCSGTQSGLNLQIVNQGECNLNISNITSNNSSFGVPSTHFPLTLSADASVDLPLTFAPPAYGSSGYVACSETTPQTASITVTSNDPVNPTLVTPVSATEGCPTMVLSPRKLNGIDAFPATVSDPTQTLGCFTDRQITVANAGSCPLQIPAGGLSASPATYFNVTNPTTPLSIAPGAAGVPITVRFRPLSTAGQLVNAPDQRTGTLSITSNDPNTADNTAGGADGLCGEPVVHSGARVLVVDAASNPLLSVNSITLQSKGLTPPFQQKLMPAPLFTINNICGNTVRFQLDNENLRPAGTTGNNPKASYTLSAKQGSTQANMSFTLGACQMQQIILQVK